MSKYMDKLREEIIVRQLISPRLDRLIDSRSPTVRFAHRGARAFSPENTLQAFRKAADLGCEGVELDVHMTRDAHLVVHHDDRLMRCTDVALKFPERRGDFLSSFTLAELKTLDAGSWFVQELQLEPAKRQAFLSTLTLAEQSTYILPAELDEFSSGSVKIPTLEEALLLAEELNLFVNIEIKSIPRMYDGISQTVHSMIRGLGLQNSILVSSFDHRQLEIMRSLDARICTGVLTSDRLARVDDYLRLLDADSFHPGCYDDFDSLGFGSVSGVLDSTSINQARNGLMMTFVWTCNQADQAEKLILENVTGLITDYPNRIETKRQKTR